MRDFMHYYGVYRYWMSIDRPAWQRLAEVQLQIIVEGLA